MKKIVLFGAGQHAKPVADVIEKSGSFKIEAFVDSSKSGKDFWGYPIWSMEEFTRNEIRSGLIAIGDNYRRSLVAKEILSLVPDFRFVSAIHPQAVLGRGVLLGQGSVVMAGAIVNPDSKIGDHCILNTNCGIDHDCVIEDFASVAPGANLCGSVHVGSFSVIGPGATVIQGVKIGRDTVIGAGATAVKDVGDGVVAIGTPCKSVKTRAPGDKYL